MTFINLHLIDVYFKVKLEVYELSQILCMFLDPWLKEGRGVWFHKPVKQTRFYCSETFYDW